MIKQRWAIVVEVDINTCLNYRIAMIISLPMVVKCISTYSNSKGKGNTDQIPFQYRSNIFSLSYHISSHKISHYIPYIISYYVSQHMIILYIIHTMSHFTPYPISYISYHIPYHISQIISYPTSNGIPHHIMSYRII